MVSNYHAILLDLDGTFADTALDFIQVVNTLRRQLGHTPLPALSIRQNISKGAKALTQLATNLDENDPTFNDHKENLLTLYESLNGQHTTLFAGMDALITWCAEQDIPWGVVTNKPLRFAEPLMLALKLAHPAATLICPDHVSRNKPDPESLLLAAKHMNVPAERCIYVGDHERDIIAGKAAGMYTLAALYGYLDEHESPDTWGYDAALTHSDQILAHIQPLIRQGEP